MERAVKGSSRKKEWRWLALTFSLAIISIVGAFAVPGGPLGWLLLYAGVTLLISVFFIWEGLRGMQLAVYGVVMGLTLFIAHKAERAAEAAYSSPYIDMISFLAVCAVYGILLMVYPAEKPGA